MPDTAPFTLVDAETERLLFALARRERLARDTGDFDGLLGLYWPGSRVRVTWYDGPVEGFVDASRASVKPGKVAGFHTIDPVRAEVAGDRALTESRGQVLLRPPVEGVECDLVSWCRFVSGYERRAGEWRMAWFDNVYVKDVVVPTVPGTAPVTDAALLAGARPSYRWLTYTNVRRGIEVPADLPGDDRPDLVAAFWADAHAWLAGG
ncbi:nuclear transport factor 2 family protein [Nocardioides sp. GY 10127]|uniref:nuclear transport factor 2 family protein n=1 Tax=Nocardioides sp. GY 10127 TaxID=2569762 RepID=UPI0010A8D698|nr:nuclear transport factor 2 family protein [Nocardioides sp. GY 10127]TIC79423.1 nuclear transport factor 2 family protein [Nocardioides sp. GY 10127]